MDIEQNWTEMDDYADDMAAQNAVEDAKYDFPEQDEPPEDYYDVVTGEDDDEEDYGAGHTGLAEAPAYVGWSFTPAAQAAYPTPAGADPWSSVWGPGYSNQPPF